MKALFDSTSLRCSKMITKSYSTSFSLGIRMLGKDLRDPIYSIYGFVRYADEIVDSFEGYDQAALLNKFWEDTWLAIEQRISLNPILHSFQQVVHDYGIEREMINTFLTSMEMDLHEQDYDQQRYETYILGSAEVVGLMCLKVFCGGDNEQYEQLRPSAMYLGSAFQKVNFLRDLRADYLGLGRVYFPGIEMDQFNERSKQEIEEDILRDFRKAYPGILQLPKKARIGVYLAYVYYHALFEKIRQTPSKRILQERIRIPNKRKFSLLLQSYLKHSLNLI